MNRVVVVAVGALLLLSACGSNDKVDSYTAPAPYEVEKIESPNSNSVKNIVFMIGDGMGLEQLSTAWVANRGQLYIDNAPITGIQRTYCSNRLITDSAAAGTALATGGKTLKGTIALSVDGEPLQSLAAKAHSAGMRTGVVVTCRLNDATPATFCCHNADRDAAEQIAADYATCGVDFIAGGGLKYWQNRSDGRNILSEMRSSGYNVCLQPDELASAKALPIAAVLADLELPPALERGDEHRMMVAKALQLLDNEEGFFLMIEGSCIDDYLHANRLDMAVEEMLDFDRTVGDVMRWAAADRRTLVVVTSDHATGAMTLLEGDIAEGRVEVNFANEGHNGIAVPYYVFGAGADNFGGIVENSELSKTIEKFITEK